MGLIGNEIADELANKRAIKDKENPHLPHAHGTLNPILAH